MSQHQLIHGLLKATVLWTMKSCSDPTRTFNSKNLLKDDKNQNRTPHPNLKVGPLGWTFWNNFRQDAFANFVSRPTKCNLEMGAVGTWNPLFGWSRKSLLGLKKNVSKPLFFGTSSVAKFKWSSKWRIVVQFLVVVSGVSYTSHLYLDWYHERDAHYSAKKHDIW